MKKMILGIAVIIVLVGCSKSEEHVENSSAKGDSDMKIFECFKDGYTVKSQDEQTAKLIGDPIEIKQGTQWETDSWDNDYIYMSYKEGDSHLDKNIHLNIQMSKYEFQKYFREIKH